MSLDNLIQFPYIPVDFYDKYKRDNTVKVTDINSITRCLDKLFKNAKAGDSLAQIILFDFNVSINHPSVYKDNITGKRIEQRLSRLFALSTGDEIPRSNPKIKTLMNESDISRFDQDVIKLVCSNYSKKGDLFFFNSILSPLRKVI